MTYLLRKKKPKVAHIFINGDTACRLYSTGGMNKSRYIKSPDANGKPLCLMCQNVSGIASSGDVIKNAGLSKPKQELAKLIREQKKDIKSGGNYERY